MEGQLHAPVCFARPAFPTRSRPDQPGADLEPVFPEPEVLFLAVPPEHPAGLSPSVADAVSASRSDVTRRVYAIQWAGFVAWADGVGVSWLPAYTHDVAQYLTDLIAGGAGLSTVRQAVSAIRAAHRARERHRPPSPSWCV